MKTNILTNFDEPTDNELVELMQAVAKEVKKKFETIKTQLSDKITADIALTQAKHTPKRG